VGILSNTVLKLGVALVVGAPAFRKLAAPALLALGAALGTGLLIGG
jgi:hypothetical protein